MWKQQRKKGEKINVSNNKNALGGVQCPLTPSPPQHVSNINEYAFFIILFFHPKKYARKKNYLIASFSFQNVLSESPPRDDNLAIS